MKMNVFWTLILTWIKGILKSLKTNSVFIKLTGSYHNLACYAIDIVIDVIDVLTGRITWEQLLSDYFSNNRTLSLDQEIKRRIK